MTHHARVVGATWTEGFLVLWSSLLHT